MRKKPITLDDKQVYDLTRWVVEHFQESGRLLFPITEVTHKAEKDLGFNIPSSRLRRVCKMLDIKTSREAGGVVGAKRVYALLNARLVEVEVRLTDIEEELTSCREAKKKLSQPEVDVLKSWPDLEVNDDLK